MTKNEYICECGHFYQDHHKQGCTVKTYSYLTEKDEFFDIQCDCSITFNQLIQKEIKTDRERIFDEINTQLHSRVIGTRYCDTHGISKLQYYSCCDKATFDEEGRYDWIWQALDQAKKNLMYSDEPR